MSSRQDRREARVVEGEQIARAEAGAREAAREITHSRTERARVLGDCERHHDGQAEEQLEMKDAAAEKATEAKDAGKQNTEELTEAAAGEKAKESTHQGDEKATVHSTKSPEQKLEEYKQSAADAARKAMEYLTARKEEVKEQPDASKASVDTTEEVVRQELDATRQRSEQATERERRWKEE